MGALPNLSAQDIADIARALSITDHATGARRLWKPNPEQLRYWQETERHRYIFVAKPRQIGLTTAVTLDDVLWTATCDAAGHRVRCGIVVDTDEKTRERMRLAADFVAQLGLEAECGSHRITFPNGSEIVGMTAGGNRAGASTTFQRLHLSELPFWPDGQETYAALMPALSPGGVCVIESTMDTRSELAPSLWRTPNAYAKVFFGVEQHDEYRSDPATLTAEDETWLREEGFTDRAAMAWWLWALENLCGGDVVRCFREFPQREEHMFQAAEGRWVAIDVTPEVPCVRRPPHPMAGRTWPRVLEVSGIAGDAWPVLIWREPAEASRQLAAWVDTAEGKGLSHSALVMIDKRDGGLVATFNDDTILGDDLARVALAVAELFTSRVIPIGQTRPDVVRPLVRIEDNGPGQTTVQAARRLGLVFEAYNMTAERQYQQMLEAKRAIEGSPGGFVGPARMAKETAGCHRDEHGRFTGPKDLLMCLGGAQVMRREVPYKDPHARRPEEDRNRVVSARRLRAARARRA
ncbi:MAG: hypothetical protein IT459_23825 [Planctomycetes bacterium]|nr:hypothetical protein [Planctomycetota bacterium]